MKRRATKSELAHLAKVRQMPCLACVKLGVLMQCGKTEGHHVLSGGRRRGHMFVVPLGRYHHQGIPIHGFDLREMEAHFGPSLRLASKKFHEQFGDGDSLLAEVNALLEKAA